MSKQNLRKNLIDLREKQRLVAKENKDRKILKRILGHPEFKKAKEFFVYLSHKGEVCTDVLIERFFGKKKIIVPKVENKQICLYEVSNPIAFVKGKFGVREPKICLPKKDWEKIDVALIPGIAFDLNGHRIGFGGGYFDRLLKKLRCTTIGLAYEFQIIEKIPTHKYDVAVDYIVTEKRVMKCNKNSKWKG